MIVRFKKYILLFLVISFSSCQEGANNLITNPFVLTDSDKNMVLRRPKVEKVKVQGGVLILEGERLDRVTKIKLSNNELKISRQKENSLLATSMNKILLHLTEVTSLVIDSAYGQSIIPIEIILNSGSVSGSQIADQSITADDIQDGSITFSKISNSGAYDNYILSYTKELGWRPTAPSSANGGGGGLSLSLGEGLVSKGSVINNTGNIEINVGKNPEQLLIIEAEPSTNYGKLTYPGDLRLYNDSHAESKLSFHDETSTNDPYYINRTENSLNFKRQNSSGDLDIISFNNVGTTDASVDIHQELKTSKAITATAEGTDSFSFSGEENFSVSVHDNLTFESTNGGTITLDSNSLSVKGEARFEGSVTIEGSFSSPSSDFAEYFKSEESLDKGDVVGINLKSGLVRKYQKGDELLGVVSTDPGFVGNKNETGEHIALVGLVGQVPFNKSQVKVVNRIVYTKDGKKIGVLLHSGRLFLRIN
ncbi:MAG: hypothetical protein CME61_06880 [Halobacteriovoraceae bacterium]|nr:hypothetical protein [Halobacteriovoraceae bacterium]